MDTSSYRPSSGSFMMKTSFWSQLKALLWRNFLLKKRNKRQFLQEIFFPVFFVSLMAMIKAFTEPKTFPVTSFPENPLSNDSFHFDTNKKLLVSPDTSEVVGLMTEISTLLGGVQYETFSSQSAAEERYKANPTNVAAGIIFSFDGGTNFKYAIRMPYRSLPSINDVFTTALNQGQCRTDLTGTSSGRKCQANYYLTTGFIWLQNAVDTALIKNKDATHTMPEISVQLMPKAKLTESLESIQIGSAIYFVLAYSFFINFLCVNLVAEKEKKIREGMKMMGLRDSAWWLAWALIYMAVILFVTVLVVLIALATSFFKNDSLLLFFIMLLLYGLSIVNLAFVLTPFFKKAQVAGLVAGFSTIIISLLYFIVSMTRTTTLTGYDYSISPAGRWALCLLSPVAFSLAIDQGIFLDIVKGGMTFSNASTGDFPLYAPIVMLVVDSFLYLFLAVYFDHVIPGEYGPRYKPWFCLTPSYWCGQRKSTELTSLVDAEGNDGPRRSEQTDDIVEPVSPDLANKAGIRISNISKVYKDKDATVTAVDGVTLDMYEGQITSLLGHNGAGKTTLINMLCGLSPPTSGTATINNMDVSHSGDMERIRSMTGVCPQHDILYDELSCREHLDIFAGIKGVGKEERDDVVEKIMKAVDIIDQADVFAKNLSGGQKRKLSVAIALIGDPKMLILDEPTAGMDPYSRRHLWSLLKSRKEGKIILLTTHFMDEADILADRKAIINHGKLKCCGSSLFLKQRFGIGYHLNMVVEPECNADRVTDLLRQHVSGIEMKRSHGKELAFTMPVAEVSRFPGMFTELEASVGAGKTQAQSLGIVSYGVFMTSLEEVFLKIGSENKEIKENEENETAEPSPQNEQHSIPMPTSNEKVNLTSQRFWTLMKIRFKIKIRNTTALIFQILIPIVLVIIGCVLSIQGTSEDTSFTKPVTMKPFYVGPNKPPFLAVDTAATTASGTFISGLGTTFEKVPASTDIATLAAHWVGFNYKVLTGTKLTYTAMYNDSAIHSLPAVINVVSNGFLTSANNIEASSLMWPSVVQSGVPKLSYNSNAFSAAFVLAVAFVVVPAGFAVEVVADRQIKANSQLRVSGITFMMYWGTLFLFHLAIYLIPAVISIIIVLAAQIPSFTTAGAMLSLVMLFVSYIPANLILSYIFAYAFETFETCQAVLPNVFIFAGIIPYIAISLMDMLGKSDVAEMVHYAMCIIDPPYIIFGGIYYIDRISRVADILQKPVTFDMYFEWDNNIIYPIIVALIHIGVMMLLLKVVDLYSSGGSLIQAIKCCISKVQDIPEENSDIPEDEDDDVEDERHRVNKLNCFEDRDMMPVAYVRNLRKEFKKRTTKHHTKENCVKVAVRNATFAVDKDEVFGLLGPNGAGKTTTLNMIIAETSATKGKIIVAGHNVHSSTSEAFQAIGYCPQHDALWPSITLKEHLACYAAIKGIPRGDIDSLVNYFVDNLKVTEHADKRADKMSGGTRRKVSYAISMLGKPKIVLLDEPSTGMDPQSKRFLWDTISSSFKSSGRGAILTTHYMEEADALCSRVAIMVNGQLQCLGSTQHLKDKFGSGYLLEIKLHSRRDDIERNMDKLEAHLARLFSQIDCLERFAERGWYRIAKGKKLLSEAFSALEDMKSSHNVEEYSFSQSTLEQVFLDFAKQQHNEEMCLPLKRDSVRRSLSKDNVKPSGGPDTKDHTKSIPSSESENWKKTTLSSESEHQKKTTLSSESEHQKKTTLSSESEHQKKTAPSSESGYQKKTSPSSESEHQKKTSPSSESEHQKKTTLSSESEHQKKTTPSSESEYQKKTSPSSESEHQKKTSPRSESEHQKKTSPSSESEHQKKTTLSSESEHQKKTTPSSESEYQKKTSPSSESEHQKKTSPISESEHQKKTSPSSESEHQKETSPSPMTQNKDNRNLSDKSEGKEKSSLELKTMKKSDLGSESNEEQKVVYL